MKTNKNLLRKVFLILSIVFCFSITYQALACSPGDKADVKWKGGWYPATVLQAKGTQCYIHYDGYDNSWNEWVGPGRIRVSGGSGLPIVAGVSSYSAGEAVMVNWKGSWWPAHVLKLGENRWYIHYDNYDSSWDEWVGTGRIKKR